MEPGEPDRHGTPAHLDPGPRREFHRPPPVAPQHPVRGVRLDLDGEHRLGVVISGLAKRA